MSRSDPPRRDKHFRDPVHDYISFRADSAVDRLLLALLETPELQRLRRIRQLGLANLVFPGAEHSRFTHALGVVHVARRMLATLVRHDPTLEDHALPLLAAALLHDVGHGPYSHAFEPITGVAHERWSSRVVLDDGTAVHRILRSRDRDLPERVDAVFRGRYREAPVLSDLVASQLDADRLDYLQRDVLATGVRHGRFDLQRILLFLRPGRRLEVDARALAAVEGYVIARAHMYEQVYYHKTVRAAETMLRAAVTRANAVGATAGLAPGLRAAVEGRRATLGEYLDTDDGSFVEALRSWSHSDDEGLARLAGGVLHRRLLKCVEIPDERWFGEGYAALRERAIDLVRRRGFDPEVDLVLDEAPEERYLPYVVAEHHEPIRILPVGRRRAQPLEDASDLVRRLADRQVFLVRWFCPRELQAPLRRLVARG